jgi:glycerol-3-phosphate dehydrogenase
MYDMLAGSENMESSYAIGRGKALEAFPMLKGDGLAGAVVYYDGEYKRVIAIQRNTKNFRKLAF